MTSMSIRLPFHLRAIAGAIAIAFCLLLPSALRAAAPSTTQAGQADAVDATQSGAVGDGVTLNTATLQAIIDACSARGGGRIRFPAGRYVTGTLQLKDNVVLQLDAQAVLLGSTSAGDYRNVDPFTAGDGIDLGHALIVAIGASHVGIEGAGEIDGQGKAVKAAQARYTVRPFLMRFIRCQNLAVTGVSLRGSGAWGIHFFQCSNVLASGLTIRNRGLMNNDGIDIDSCQDVRVADCDIDSGDDAICLKATSPRACRNIVVQRCTLKTSCNAIKLGTESIGDFENVRVGQCKVRDIGMAGIALYCVDGADLHDVEIADVAMENVTVPISVRLGARLKTFRAGDQAKPPGRLRDITIRNVQAKGARQIGLLINGIPGHPIEALTLENIEVQLPGGGKATDAAVELAEKESAYPEMLMFGRVMPAHGMYVRHVNGVTFRNVRTTVTKPDARPAAVFIDVHRVDPPDFVPTTVDANLPRR